jgi:tetratricopeptide (TPR) repeat protein
VRSITERKNFWNKKEEILNTSDGLALKADLLAFENRFEEAVDYYTRALELNPQNPHLWAFKGITLKGGLDREEEARECWDRAKKLDPDLAEAVRYSERSDIQDKTAEGPVTCAMSETSRQKILKLMREQADQSLGE